MGDLAGIMHDYLSKRQTLYQVNDDKSKHFHCRIGLAQGTKCLLPLEKFNNDIVTDTSFEQYKYADNNQVLVKSKNASISRKLLKNWKNQEKFFRTKSYGNQKRLPTD